MFPYVGCLCTRSRRRRRWLLVCAAQGFDVTGDVKLVVPSIGLRLHTVSSPSSSNVTPDGGVTGRAMAVHRGRRERSRSVPPSGTASRRPPAHPLATRRINLYQSALIEWPSPTSTTQCLLNRCSSWSFDPFLLNYLSNGHPVVSFGLHVFQRHNFVTVFRLDWTRLSFCLSLIENGYCLRNPFHNAVHATDVAQAMHCFLTQPLIDHTLTDLDKMACLFAAFAHDLHHPGVNQKYLEATNHFLSSLYNKVSVLENFHWRCLVAVLKQSQLLDHLPAKLWNELVQVCKLLILATDMQRQQEYLNQFKVFLRESDTRVLRSTSSNIKLMQPPPCSQSSRTSLDRLFVMQILIKCADISNPCRPWRLSQEWSFRACLEFFNQGDEERRRALQVTSFCDRYNTTMPKIQSGFMEYVAQPLFTDLDRFIQSDLSSQMLNHLRHNCDNWTALLNTEVQLGAVESPRSTTVQPPSRSTLHQMAEFEYQSPETLQKRRASTTVLLSQPYRRPSSLAAAPPASPGRRRVSLPARMLSSTHWTIETSEKRVFHSESMSDLSSAPIVLQPPPEAEQLPPLNRITRVPQLADVPESSSSTASLGDEHTWRSSSEHTAERPALIDAPVGFAERAASRRHSEPATSLLGPSCAVLQAQLGPLAHLGTAALESAQESVPSLPRRGSLPVVGRQLEVLRLAQQGNSLGSCSTTSSNSSLCQVGAS